MSTDVQRRALSNYRKKYKQVYIRFYPNDERDDKIYTWLKSQTNITEYLKALIEADMNKQK